MQKMNFTEQGVNTRQCDLMSFDHTHISELFDDPKSILGSSVFPGKGVLCFRITQLRPKLKFIVEKRKSKT